MMHTSISTFTESFISFNSSFLQMFGHLLGLGSFDGLEGPLVCKQTTFPITFGGIGPISTSTITQVAYLGNWAFIVLIITIRFMVDQHPFLFEILA
jgi:hypothetical protein